MHASSPLLHGLLAVVVVVAVAAPASGRSPSCGVGCACDENAPGGLLLEVATTVCSCCAMQPPAEGAEVDEGLVPDRPGAGVAAPAERGGSARCLPGTAATPACGTPSVRAPAPVRLLACVRLL